MSSFCASQQWLSFYENMSKVTMAPQTMNYSTFYISSSHLLKCPWDIFIYRGSMSGETFKKTIIIMIWPNRSLKSL